jgi:hypothetical protein
MSRKTKKHRHSAHHRRHKRRYSHNHLTHHRAKTRRKRREISIIPGSKSVPIFTAPNKKNSESILVNVEHTSGNIVPGLRNYMKNM